MSVLDPTAPRTARRRAPLATRPDQEPRRAPGARRAGTRRSLPRATAVLLALCAALLAGIVAVQVAVLRLNIQRGQLEHTQARLTAQNVDLKFRLDAATSEVAVAARARALGMYQPPPESVTYLAGG